MMACMEHSCVRCGTLVLNNESTRRVPCLECGGTRWVSTWDEAGDHARRDEDGEDISEDTD